MRSKPYPSWPRTSELDEQNILKALRNHRWCTFDGEFIPKFEKAWAEKIGANGCVMTPCGTHALHVAVELLGIGPGDEVLVAPFTYIATIDAIMLSYALPVFVDSDLKTFQMDPSDIEHRITEHTRAILPVHILGGAANMDEVLAIARRHNLPVIEDACQGQLAEWREKKLGTLGTVGCFSFQESEIIPGGEAGAFVSADQELINKAYCFRDFGSDQKGKRGYFMRGTKYRISDFAAAVLMAQLTRLDDVCATREKHAAYLKRELRQVPGLMAQEHLSPVHPPELLRLRLAIRPGTFQWLGACQVHRSDARGGNPHRRYISSSKQGAIPRGVAELPTFPGGLLKGTLGSIP